MLEKHFHFMPREWGRVMRAMLDVHKLPHQLKAFLRCLIMQPWFIQPDNLNKIMCFPDQPLGPLTFIKHSPGTHLPHPSLWRMPRTQRHLLSAALAGKIQNFQEMLNLVKSHSAPRLFFTCLFQDSDCVNLKSSSDMRGEEGMICELHHTSVCKPLNVQLRRVSTSDRRLFPSKRGSGLCSFLSSMA